MRNISLINTIIGGDSHFHEFPRDKHVEIMTKIESEIQIITSQLMQFGSIHIVINVVVIVGQILINSGWN